MMSLNLCPPCNKNSQKLGMGFELIGAKSIHGTDPDAAFWIFVSSAGCI